MERLHIDNEMRCLDLKQRDFYDSLTDEERKKFSNYLMIRWSSTVQGDANTQEYYVMSCNHYLNRHFFAVNRHPKLQWLMATAVSAGVGAKKHGYIRPKKKDTSNNNVRKMLTTLYPNAKLDDIEVLASITEPRELREHLRQHGITDKE